MKKILTALAAGAMLAAPGLTRGEPSSAYAIRVANKLHDHAVWVTTYASSSRRDTIIRAQCFSANTGGSMMSASNDKGGWVLFEVKQDAHSCANHSNIATIEKNVKVQVTMWYAVDGSILALAS